MVATWVGTCLIYKVHKHAPSTHYVPDLFAASSSGYRGTGTNYSMPLIDTALPAWESAYLKVLFKTLITVRFYLPR